MVSNSNLHFLNQERGTEKSIFEPPTAAASKNKILGKNKKQASIPTTHSLNADSKIRKIYSVFSSFINPFFNIFQLYGKSKIRELKIEKILPEDFGTTAKMMRAWKTIANEKKDRTNPENYVKFSDCSLLCDIINRRLDTGAFGEAYICKDLKGREQGIMLIDTDKYIHSTDSRFQGRYVKIGYLVTHPRNIRCFENKKDPQRAEGVGTSLIAFAQKRAEELHKDGVFLEGVPSAKPFYLKVGFEEIPTDLIEDGYYTMVKTSDKITKQITQPFAAAA